MQFNAISFYYSTAALLAMLSAVIATAIPSVRLSVTRWYCTQTNEDRIMRSSLRGNKSTLVSYYQQWFGVNVPLENKICAQSALKSADFEQYLLITSQP